jgi:hypothetical protein
MSRDRPRPGAEWQRLEDHRLRRADWELWGPYLSDRAWGTVREDYSPYGDVWNSFPHDHARSRAYRWNEDGLAGISDRSQYLCLALTLWNGKDPILKERLYGLSGPEGNHGEDVKELYYYLDATPTHSYLRMLYKYPQAAFPYRDLITENAHRSGHDPEYEVLDTGAFDGDRYFDVTVEYAKASETDVLMRIEIANRGPETAICHVLPTVWFRNTWSWGHERGPMGDVVGRPAISVDEWHPHPTVTAEHSALGTYHVSFESADAVLFTENETNHERLSGTANSGPFTKDAFHRLLVDWDETSVNPAPTGTKAAGHRFLEIGPGEAAVARVRLSDQPTREPFAGFDDIVARRRGEADEFYETVHGPDLDPEARRVQRQALAGMIWGKQLYYYDVSQWLDGDPAGPVPAADRHRGRNSDWRHLNNFDVLSMPDPWEYPWYAAWDLAFHAIPLAMIDAGFAKRQIDLMTREWYLHPNGQMPAYEWEFGDVNPPVHAWAARRVFEMDAAVTGDPDLPWLEAIFHKLLLNFTWWVNRKDAEGNNVFQGGFLGLDNISLFDRSSASPGGGRIDQSDGTAWMAFYTLEMLRISLRLAEDRPVYQHIATKFAEHFLGIAHALTYPGHCLWDGDDEFFYDILRLPGGEVIPLRVRSLVGLIPLLGVETIERSLLDRLPDFARRLRWFAEHRPHLAGNMASLEGASGKVLFSVLTPERLRSLLGYLLDDNEFLGRYGIRSLSAVHRDRPFRLRVGGRSFSIKYEPAESTNRLYGGNSNWRGPIWMPINYLLIESLDEYHAYYGDGFRVECPTGSGNEKNLAEVSDFLARRVIDLFLPDAEGRRPLYGGIERYHTHPDWRDLLVFPEYFSGDDGAGLGAMHQTGWTGLVADLIHRHLR